MNLKTLALAACAATAVYAAPDPNFHIYLAFGQSNMEGQGDVGQQDKTVDERFQVLWAANNGSCSGKTKGKWSTAVPPLAHCQGAKLGPTDYFGRTMVEKTDSQIKVGVIVVAVAGCSIDLFDKNNYANYARSQQSWMTQRINEYGGNPYGRLIEMGKIAQEVGVIKGIIFHQGETDAGNGQWPSKVKSVYDNIVKDLGLGNDIPFLAGEVLRSGSSAGANNNIAKLPQQSKNFYVVSSEGFNQALGDGQNVHFTAQEYRDFGKRYAEKMIEVLGDKVKPVGTAAESSSSEAVVESSSSEAVVESSSSSRHHGWPSYSSSYIGTIDPTAINVPQAQSRFIGKAVVNAGKVTIPVAMEKSPIVAKVFSMQGKAVLDFSDSFAGGSLGFDTARLPQGSYMLSVQVGSERSVQKVQIK
ncbi:Por secretion system C-terminal sorting domain-containing protein [Fibrobacter sp. UWT3]|uniref:sialate O-acetylesterase n=1 Tax=Fibrobacter sp. UWT3 TaxID=1896225 RepID=UPI000BDDB63C|nr:sialate O-acetylesterase [Fibrobacter sp. UWT3]SOE78397.1 Por secretion system C-terminal sorting domain-containing protein [Fibrobacter sp. UWT3]